MKATIRNAIYLIATIAISTWATASFSHGNAMHEEMREVRKEQKDWGIAGDRKDARRSITIRMGDNMRFTPDKLNIRQGETVRLVIQNKGRLLHELVLGTQEVLDEHAALMMKFPGMEHDEPYMAHVPAGKTSEMIWTFNRAGDFDFACLIAGHYQAGMVGKIRVAAAKP